MLRTRSIRHIGRRGLVAVQATLCLAVLLGIAAITIDGGLMQAERRRAQATSDAAALAAAADLLQRAFTNNGLDPSPYTARDSSLNVATANGYTSSNSVITPNVADGSGKPVHGVWIPPISGDHVGKAGYAEVAVQYNQKRFFSSIWGSSDIPIRARSVARGMMGPSDASILVLSPTASPALSIVGGVSITVPGKVIVDSNANGALNTTGNSSILASGVDVVGTITLSNGSSVSAPASGSTTNVFQNDPSLYTPDPLASLAPPSSAGLSVIYNKPNRQMNPGTNQVLQPGIYIGGIDISKSGVQMQTGVYFIEKGDFSVSTGSGTVTSQSGGVLIYLTTDGSGTYSKFSLSAQSFANLSPLSTGKYAGITIFQDRNAPLDNPLSIAGGSGSKVRGMIYAPRAFLNVTGSSTVIAGESFIANTLKMNGSTGFLLPTPAIPVNAKRLFGLVE